MGRLRNAIWLGLISIILRIYLNQKFRRDLVTGFINTKIGQIFVLNLTRLLLGYLIPPLLVNFYYRWPTYIAQDGQRYFDHIKYVRRTRYGSHVREELDELLPIEGALYEHFQRTKVELPSGLLHLALLLVRDGVRFTISGFDHHPHAIPTKIGRVIDSSPAILFGHGGGWVCQGTDVQLGQLPAVARQTQMAVYSFNYPLAPEDPFPAGVISALRAMSYLKTHRGYEDVALLGESAGGNLISMAALFVSNPKLMKLLAEESNTNVHEWEYPNISCVINWYSILDHQEWKDNSTEHAWLWQGLEIVWDMYLSKTPKLMGKCTPCQWETELENYPPTLTIAGSYDPLGLCESAHGFHKMLQSKGLQSTLSIYDATHGFVGYPPAFQQALAGGDATHWRENCARATDETNEFLKLHHGDKKRTRVLGG